MILPFCVYVLFSHKDHFLYTGFSGNLARRLEAHNKGENRSTASRIPLELIFCEFYRFREDALRREQYFKTTAGKKALKLMLRETMLKLGYPPVVGIISLD